LYQVGMFCLGRDLLTLNIWEPEGPIIITANGDFAFKDIVELAYSQDGHEERMKTLEFGMVGLSLMFISRCLDHSTAAIVVIGML
jgi:hypothetical protein